MKDFAPSLNENIAIEVRDAVKRFGSFTALERISVSIRDNEFFTLLGPSGCGKTTLLRMIAGFEDTTEGTIFLHGREIAALPPHKRPINTVFQNYALFPRMSVVQNVMFGLEMQGQAKSDARKKALEMLELVQLSQFADRMPTQLSGGQQQRVALARALAPKPEVLLLDEPLSALDLKLRQAMRFELKQIQRDTGITFIFVTHDQEEALTMSDRIAVMSAGRLQQLGTAREIYEAPRNRFVADFIGETNLLAVSVETVTGTTAKCTLDGGHALTCTVPDGVHPGTNSHVSIRPERLVLSRDPAGAGFPGTVRESIYLGTDLQTHVRIEGGPQVMVRSQNSQKTGEQTFEPGSSVYVNIEPGVARLLAD